ncbi:sulfate transporter [Caballeronia ptereochthonis]|uniref:Sulfate transporter n=1 Tax=Caballeronia ptereochthonis TaxID=1777144 RepID=A0A157ZR91_9BURK|nr:sulfate transporter [Caballeronia ptereochthonis]
MLRSYRAGWLRNDIVAGLVLTTMLVPVGVAYAEASGVPGVCGLYATIVPLLAYAIFGPSRILVLGPDSALAAPVLAVVVPSASDPSRAIRRGGHDGDRLRCRLRGVRAAEARLCHGAAVEADPLRLYERHRADGAHQRAAETLRDFPRRSGTAPRHGQPGQTRRGRAVELVQLRRRGGQSRAHPAAQALRQGPRHPDRRRAGDALCKRASARPRRRQSAWNDSARTARVLATLGERRGYRQDCARRLRGRADFLRGHERALAYFRRALQHARRSKSGNDRARRRQSRDRPLPGLSDQQQFIAHARRRSGRRENAGDRHHAPRRMRQAGRDRAARRRSSASPTRTA